MIRSYSGRKLRYYKEVINPALANYNYLFAFTTPKKKMNIAKIRINFFELQSEIKGWSIPETPWDEITYHLCNTKRVEDV